MFHTNLLEDVGLSPETLYPKVLPRPLPILSLDQIPAFPAPVSITSSPIEYQPPPYAPISTGRTFPAARSRTRSPDGHKPYQPDEWSANTYRQPSGQVGPYGQFLPYIHRLGCELLHLGEQPKEPREPFINEEVEDFKDALSPMYDQLTLNWWWWILEFIPVKQVSLVALFI